MMLVKSKYKNPDKFIEQLKEKIKWANDSSDLWAKDFHREKGKYWFAYAPGVTLAVSTSIDKIQQATIGQRVRFDGEVISLKKNVDKYEAVFEIHEVRLLEDHP